MFDFILNFDTPWQILCCVILLGVGVFFLVKFCDIFVDAASALAKKLKIPPLIIGLTIVAMGTSCPELAVSTSDSIKALLNGNHANIAIGNVVGSNICNLLLVLGLSAVFTPIMVKKSIRKKEFPLLLGVSALFVLFGCLFGITDEPYAITRWEAIIFVVLMVAYMIFVIVSAKKDKENEIDPLQGDENKPQGEENEIKDMPLLKSIVLSVIGIAGIIVGGEMVVTGAKGLATMGALAIGLDHDLTEALVGLTIVAVGTSLPELVTSIVAAKKGENELALGNVVGSNIFNILFILGIAGTVNPLTTGSQIVIDLIVMLVATVAVFLMALKGKLKKSDGVIMILMYAAYLAYLIIRTLLAKA
jgi:cation:H+ antiporter